MDFGLLGPVRAESDEQPINLGSRKQRLVLAVLLLNANKYVATARLVRTCWPDQPPPTARRIIHTHVSRLRSALAVAGAGRHSVSLDRHGAGYVLTCDPLLIDVHRFRDLIRRARATEVDEEKVVLLEQALGLWRGAPLDDVANDRIRADLCGGLEEALLAAMQDRWDAQLRLGRHRVIVDELVERAVEHPQQQRITGQLMLALYRAGRPADALDVYRQYRRRLADEFGIDPGAELRRLELAVLRADPELDHVQRPTQMAASGQPPADAHAPASDHTEALRPAPVLVPAQLPRDVDDFTGRAEQLAFLDATMFAAGGTGTPEGERATVVVVSGTAGVGKTALAVHWAHRVARRFPDGQLYVNLRGFDPSGSAMAPAEAIRGFLDAFAVPAQQIPATVDAQAALYRSILSGKRVLVVLDNASDAEQVRPLLPAAGGCRVVVTSRSHLSSLVAAGARPIGLDLFCRDEAAELLVRRLGADRVSQEPQAVDGIINLCARLPLALSVMTARAAAHPRFSLAALVGELEDAHGSLDAFTDPDPVADARAVFSWSYTTLTPDAARLFRLLSLCPGPDISAPAAASLAAAPVSEVRLWLTELARGNLVTEHAPGRYGFHDLLRAYAGEKARALDTGTESRTALHRVLDHYLHSAYAADLLLDPHRRPIDLAPALPGVVPEQIADGAHALAWFAASHSVLLAAVDQATGAGFDQHAWQLAWTLVTFLDRRGHWLDLATSQRAAVAAAERDGTPATRAWAHRSLGRALSRVGCYDAARAHYLQALALYGDLGDRLGHARTQIGLGAVFERERRYPEALQHKLRALDLLRDGGPRDWLARALNSVGWVHAQLGDCRAALRYCGEALALHHETGDRRGQAHTQDSLGYAHHHLGHHHRAVGCYRRSLDLWRELGERYQEAGTLARLGDAHRDGGDPVLARAFWQHALEIFLQLGHTDADQVRARLDEDRAITAGARPNASGTSA